ncbi:MAG: glycosyltransferase [Ignavibacteriales bacterium]|nr:glycosyltransferase [Ignavibacteriales bacterium]
MKRKEISLGIIRIDYPKVSVIIPMYNEERNVVKKMENSFTLNYPQEKIEFLIGSDGSTDKTNEILKTYDHKANTKIFYFSRKGKAGILNALEKEASGEILLFTDGDCLLHSNAIQEGVTFFSNENVGGVCGNLLFTSANNSKVRESFYWKFETLLRKYESEIKTIIGGSGQIIFIKKIFYRNLPDNIGIADDFVIPMSIIKQGKNFVFAEKAIATTNEVENVQGEFRRRVRIGTQNFQSFSFLSEFLNPRYGFVTFALVSHKVLRWFAPFLMFGLLLSSWFVQQINSFLYYLWISQIIFYGFSFLGFIISVMGKKNRLLIYPYYFLAMNAALFVGFLKFLFNKQKPTWEVIR